MLLSEFDYPLPKELIAQEALAKRDQSRLLVLPHVFGQNNKIEHKKLCDIVDYFRSGDVIVLNNTQVLPAKLVGKKSSGGKVDVLVLPATQEQQRTSIEQQEVTPKLKFNQREVMIRGGGIRIGTVMEFISADGQKKCSALIRERIAGARWVVEFDPIENLEAVGQLPLPPYIKQKLTDPSRYQTVYAKELGSLAAPTAGLHFTPALIAQIKSKGVVFVSVTLHVGLGTFAPIRTDNIEEWHMHEEHYEVTPETAAVLNQAIQEQRRVFAVGTTSVRTLESVTRAGVVSSGVGQTSIFIYPGYTFQFPYAGLLTNFHLPKSTLLLLVSALIGKERLMEAYSLAVAQRYRFFSLGDAMLIQLVK